MFIQSSDVSMSSYRKYEKTTSYSTSISNWGSGGTHNTTFDYTSHSSEETGYESRNLLSGGSQESITENTSDNPVEHFNRTKKLNGISISSQKTVHQMIFDMTFNYILDLMFGMDRFDKDNFISNAFGRTTRQADGGTTSWEYYNSESESTSFETQGTVKTADGREIDFGISVKMSRQFEEYYAGSIDWGAARQTSMCDPLVINLDSLSADVTDQEFYFDIDADGIKDKISGLASGSGFLALDKNNDGIINDGSELFGTSSGDGFKDLAAYDLDGNGWIDEADAIFGALKIWSKDSSGRDILIPISAAGIGAIYLGNSDTDFSLNSESDNRVNARIRKTGIFLYENGMAGTIQHLDMAKH